MLLHYGLLLMLASQCYLPRYLPSHVCSIRPVAIAQHHSKSVQLFPRLEFFLNSLTHSPPLARGRRYFRNSVSAGQRQVDAFLFALLECSCISLLSSDLVEVVPDCCTRIPVHSIHYTLLSLHSIVISTNRRNLLLRSRYCPPSPLLASFG